jgi:spermidine synthase
MLVAIVVIAEPRNKSAGWKAKSAYVLFALALLSIAGRYEAGPLNDHYLRLYWGSRDVLGSFDSRYGYLAAVRDGEQVTIFSDGSPAASFPDPQHDETLAHVAMASCAAPWQVLLIGGSFTGMAREVLKHGVTRVDYVQIDPGWLELEREFAPGFKQVYDDQRTRVIIGDGREWLKSQEIYYDAIIVDLADPFTAAQDRYYTAEFMIQARQSLVPGGVLAMTAGTTPPNKVYTPGQLGLLAGVMDTAKVAFKRVEALPLDFNLVLAGDSLTDFALTPTAIDTMLAGRGINSFYASSGLIGPELAPDLLRDIKEKVAKAPVVIDRDLFPRGYFYGIMLWAERASPWTREVIMAAARLPVWSLLMFPLLAALAGYALERGDRAAGEAAVAAGVSGFAGVVVEVAVMIAYQVTAGAVYSAIALLTASFMAGLAVGAWVGEMVRERAGLLTMEAALAGWIALAILIVARAGGAGVRGAGATVIFCFVLLGQGAAAGAVFAAASRRAVRQEAGLGRAVGLVYGTELVGSALGGLVTGAVLAPVFGIVMALAAALLAAVGLIVHSIFARRREESLID